MTEPPIKGMAVMPGHCDNPLMAGAFVAMVRWACGEPDIRSEFKADTGHDLSRLSGRSAITKQIDRSAGYEGDLVAKFADWCAVNLWGVDEQEPQK